MRKIVPILLILSFLSIGLTAFLLLNKPVKTSHVLPAQTQDAYWFVLYREKNREELYWGEPGKKDKSELVREFVVKTGMPGERPTPLPKLLGKEYWVITKKHAEMENPETAPYFLTLNIPAPSEAPFGPSPYTECNGMQCDWITPGSFGLHGTGGNPAKLSEEDPGSSGCIRHSDEDITFLYELLDPASGEIRYYIEA